MMRYFKQFVFFKNSSEDIVKQCCRVLDLDMQCMQYEVLQKNYILYRRSEPLEDEDKKLYLVISGEIGIYLNKPRAVIKEQKEHQETVE